MVEFIKHRVNKIKDLESLEPNWGAEIDLRSSFGRRGKIHLSHDCWENGDDFALWLTKFKARRALGPLILNTKEAGMETRLLELLSEHQIENYFFLDTSLPSLIHWSIKNNNPHFALRLSAYEPFEMLQSFIGKVRWVWVDCFDGNPLDPAIVKKAKANFRICLVSPELQGKSLKEISKFNQLYPFADAVCTKEPQAWKQFQIESGSKEVDK